MTFGSVFFGNSKGTLNNDMSINTPSDGVNIALHNIEGSTIKQVQVNNPGDVYSKTLDSTSKSATYDFKASYVRADASKAATAGYVKPTQHIPLLTSKYQPLKLIGEYIQGITSNIFTFDNYSLF